MYSRRGLSRLAPSAWSAPGTISRIIEALEIDVGSQQPRVRVTVSLELSGLKPGASEPAQGEMAEAADKALYAAKGAGRNQLVVAR